MSGNAMEEGLLLQIHNPSHSDPTRIGFLAGALSGFAAIVAITIVLPGLPRLVTVYLAIGVAAAVGSYVTLKIKSRRKQYKVSLMIEKRQMQATETNRQIADMLARKSA